MERRRSWTCFAGNASTCMQRPEGLPMSAIQATVGTQTEVIDAVRPRFSDLWNSYPVGMAAGDVYKLVGGNAYALYKENPADYANACALRLSRALNYGGLTITSTAT